MDLTTLNEQYGINKKVTFISCRHTAAVRITGAHSTALVSLYGAQVLSFIPKGKEDVLFMSGKSYFSEGKAIRGGIPVCWPWFGAHPTDSSLPSHGFARTSVWDVIGTQERGDDLILTLGLSADEATLKLWPHHFEAQLEVCIGQELSVALKTVNTDNKAFEISSALHSYFNVTDINTIRLDGLCNSAYLDDVTGKEGLQKEKHLCITERIDRRYRQSGGECSIIDGGKTIKIAKEGSRITVVWNPGTALSQQMADLGDKDYLNMLCVEAANSLEDTITLLPGEQHVLKTGIGQH